jgi:hypothetical protein
MVGFRVTVCDASCVLLVWWHDAGREMGIDSSSVPVLLFTDHHELRKFIKQGGLVGDRHLLPAVSDWSKKAWPTSGSSS